MVGGVASARPNGEHFDGVGFLLVGNQSIDDSVLSRSIIYETESEATGPGEIAGDMPISEALAHLAVLGQISNSLEGRIDKLFVDLSKGASVIQDLGKQGPVERLRHDPRSTSRVAGRGPERLRRSSPVRDLHHRDVGALRSRQGGLQSQEESLATGPSR